MKALILTTLLAVGVCTLSCNAQDVSMKGGVYKQKGSSVRLELNTDNTYILYNPRGSGHFDLAQCDYASKGKWRQVSGDVVEVTSEDHYLKQEGFKYELKGENQLSPDSLYIKINLPDSLIYYKNGIPVTFSFTFNNSSNKSISSNKGLITLSKHSYLLPKTPNSVNRNHIAFSVNANTSGTSLYKGRVRFEIFEDDVDTEKTNYLTINLPYFDLCFLEFEPYNQDLIFIKSKNELVWKGKSWEKQP